MPLFVLLHTAAASYSLEEGSLGETSCKCIDAFQYNVTLAVAPGSGASCPWKAEATGNPCYTADYGNIGCGRYDMSETPASCQVEGPPAWCEKNKKKVLFGLALVRAAAAGWLSAGASA